MGDFMSNDRKQVIAILTLLINNQTALVRMRNAIKPPRWFNFMKKWKLKEIDDQLEKTQEQINILRNMLGELI